MDIYINGKQLEYRIENEKTIGEILGSLESECEKAGMTITGILADGKAIPAESLDDFFKADPASTAKMDITTISGSDVIEMLKDLGSKFTECVPRLKDIPVQLQTGKDLAVMETINAFSVSLQSLYQAIPLISITSIKDAAPVIDGIVLTDYPTELSPLLSDLLEALKKHDTVLVGDLSEYELAPRIERLGAVLSSV